MTTSAAPDLVSRLSVLYLEANDAGTRHFYALIGLGGKAPSFGAAGTVPGPGDKIVGARIWVKDELEASGKSWAEFARHNPDLTRYRPIGSRAVSPRSGAVAASGHFPGFLDAGLPEGAANLRRISELGQRLAAIADLGARTSNNGIDDLVVPSASAVAAPATPAAQPKAGSARAGSKSAPVTPASSEGEPAAAKGGPAERISERVLEMLRDGVVPWQRSWYAAGGGARNIAGHQYRGINAVLLPALGYGSPYWMTFGQAVARGGSVRAGEHGFPVIWWRFRQIEKEDAKTGTKTMREQPIAGLRIVFNLEQIDGITPPPDEAAAHTEFTPIEAAERIVAGMKAAPPISNDGGIRAYYLPKEDTVHLPAKDRFPVAEDYYGTLFHELCHSTGHPSRLNRPGVATFDHFGSEKYSREELVAEIGAAILSGEIGIERTFENNAAYVASWMKRIASDPRALIAAGSAAQRAADRVLGREWPVPGAVAPTAPTDSAAPESPDVQPETIAE